MLAPLGQASDLIGRDAAREAALRELSKPDYQVGKPSLIDRALARVVEEIGELIDELVNVIPGGLGGLTIGIVLLVVIVVLARLGLGPTGIRDALTDRRRGARGRTAEDYRREAEELSRAGDHKDAVRARFRAIVRELEQRGVLDVRPGRTAGEIAAEAMSAVPSIGAVITTAATVFAEVWYGERQADAAVYATVRDADLAVMGARLAVVSA